MQCFANRNTKQYYTAQLTNTLLLSSRVIVLTDSAHSHKCHGVLIGFVGVDVMQGGGIPGVPIAASEVHTHSKVDLTTTHDVVEEGVYLTCLWRRYYLLQRYETLLGS